MVNPLAFITETDSDRNGERPGAPETPEPFEKARTEDANGPKEVRTKRGNTDTALVICKTDPPKKYEKAYRLQLVGQVVPTAPK